MAFWLPLTMAGLSASKHVFGGLAHRDRQRAKNKAKVERWKHRVAVQDRKWYNSLSIYNIKSRTQVPLKRVYANQAAAQGYADAQVGLNNAWKQAMLDNNKILTDYLQKHAGVAGAQNQGVSANRLSAMTYGAMRKAQYQNTYAVAEGISEKYKSNVEKIRNKLLSAHNKIDAQVAFAPQTPIRPPAPVMEDESAWTYWADAAFSGIDSYLGYGGSIPGISPGAGG